jgi:hypothetical protein
MPAKESLTVLSLMELNPFISQLIGAMLEKNEKLALRAFQSTSYYFFF